MQKINDYANNPLLQEFWKTVVEVDQAWIDYERNPAELNYGFWAELIDKEKELRDKLGIDKNGEPIHVSST
jgi:hypothetical protein